MPYKRRGYRPRRRYNRRRKLNKRQAIQVKRIINVNRELKYLAINSAGAFNVTTTPQIDGSFFDIPQGTTDVTRVGDRINWCGKVRFRLQVFNALGVSADNYNTQRWILVQYHPASTSAPTPVVTDILLTGPSGAVDVHSQYNHDKRQDYKVLFDRTFTTVGSFNYAITADAPGTAVTHRYMSYNISLKKARKQVQYQGGGLQATNRLFWIYMSDSSATPHPTAIVSTKVFFRDA